MPLALTQKQARIAQSMLIACFDDNAYFADLRFLNGVNFHWHEHGAGYSVSVRGLEVERYHYHSQFITTYGV